jgi:DNA invertase Pin-like site-specific DNA recombinase
MVTDAMNGLIDIVITKSIPRFARNTMDTLKYVRLFKDYQVAIIFEKENINTLTMNCEMLLTILSSLAQQESESLSANVKMGLKMKMKRGGLVGYQCCLGYDYDKQTKESVINEEEARIVRYIFDRYTEGIGCFVIAKELTAMGLKTKRGNTNWGDTTVRGIITNEKYKGDVLMGKTFTVDPISKHRLDNFGEEEKYYIENHHEPIISEQQFEEAQIILRNRSKNHNKGRMNKFSQ